MSGVRHARDAALLAAAAFGRPHRGAPRLSYGRALPPPGDEASGGLVKFQRLQEAFPPAGRDFNLLYLGSNTLPRTRRPLLALARRRRIPVAWNQDGVAYPGWHGPGWRRANEPMARGLAQAAHVFYQSAFCKLSADEFLGEPRGSWEILYNAVDTDAFVPAASRPERPLTLLLGGNQYQRYRYETALRTLALLPEARLVVSGRLSWSGDAPAEARALAGGLGVESRIEHSGPYRQADAPRLYARADILLHTKVNDPCPNVVVEALACGLPVVYAASGGVPELVGGSAGIGVPVESTWERDAPADPSALAQAVRDVHAELPARSAAARERAVGALDLKAWIGRHREVFERLAA